MIGSALAGYLAASGHSVRRIGRSAPQAGSTDIQWDPARGLLNARALEGVDAVVNLAGATIAERWTAAHKRDIRESRVRGTELLARTIAQLDGKPRVLVSASAVGIYGERGSDVLDESSPSGQTWLAEVAREWEGAADPARAAGIRVVHPRLGIVIAAAGGVLGKLLPIFRLGGGGKVGSGAHWVSWIALEDVLGGLHWMLQQERATGAINLTGPAPVTNAEFTRVLGAVLHRPTVATVPPFALKLVFGEEMTREVLMGSQRVVPAVLERAGFEFRCRTVEQAFRRLYPTTSEARRVMASMRTGKGHVTTFETEFVSKDGRAVPVAISGSIIHDEQGREQGSIGFAKDIGRLREHDQLVTLGQLAVSLARQR